MDSPEIATVILIGLVTMFIVPLMGRGTRLIYYILNSVIKIGLALIISSIIVGLAKENWNGRLEYLVFIRLISGLLFAVAFSTGFLNKKLGYTRFSWVPYAFTWGFAIASYVVIRFGFRPKRWKGSNGTDFENWRRDFTDKRPYPLMSILGGVSMVIAAVIVRCAIDASRRAREKGRWYRRNDTPYKPISL